MLPDPRKATLTSGFTLDKCLPRPGSDLPDEWLPPSGVLGVGERAGIDEAPLQLRSGWRRMGESRSFL